MTAHVIRWFARVEPSDEHPDGYLPRTSGMRGRDWGWDVRCSCGWDSRTGGAIEASIKRSIEDHRWKVDPDGEARRSDERWARRVENWRARSTARLASVGIVRSAGAGQDPLVAGSGQDAVDRRA